MDQRAHNKATDDQGKGARNSWMIDKKIPLALLLAIVVQTGVMSAWFASFKATTESDIAQLKKTQAEFGDTKVVERLVRMETLLEAQKDILGRMEARMANRDAGRR